MEDENDPQLTGFDRRTYLQGVAAAGAVGGLGGLSTVSVGAQENAQPEDTVTAEPCGTFTGGPQVQQCVACVEAECPDQEVFPLYPLFTGLRGKCFTPETIPSGAEYVTLKAGTQCFIAPVDGNTTFCVPPTAPDISNATFYRCGGEPTPTVIDYEVFCEEITVFTENVADGTTLTATVSFTDADGEISQDDFTATVQNGAATFDLPGDLNPVYLVVTLNDTVLVDELVEAQDFPCTPEPPEPPTPDPRIDSIEVTCEAITIQTTDIPEGDTLFVRVGFVGTFIADYPEVVVDEDGQAVVTLDGNLDPAFLLIEYGDETLFEGLVSAIDAPCAEVPPEPPEPPEPPKPPKRKKRRKKWKAYKRKKRAYEKEKKKYEKGNSSKYERRRKKRAYRKAKREYQKYENDCGCSS